MPEDARRQLITRLPLEDLAAILAACGTLDLLRARVRYSSRLITLHVHGSGEDERMKILQAMDNECLAAVLDKLTPADRKLIMALLPLALREAALQAAKIRKLDVPERAQALLGEY